MLIATPDHTHAVITHGRDAGRQARLMPEAADAQRLRGPHAGQGGQASAKSSTQMGIQGHSIEGIRLICEWIRSRPDRRSPRGGCLVQPELLSLGARRLESRVEDRPKETPPVPAKLDWDLWIGPAPMRPYHRAYHPVYVAVLVGLRLRHDGRPWGAYARSFYSALKLTAPTSVEATTCGNTAEVHPLSAIVTFRFPARARLPPVKLTWYEGTRPPRPAELEDGRQMPAEGGVLLQREQGDVMAGVYGDSPQMIPEAKRRATTLPPKTLPRIGVCHEEQWVRACKGGQPGGAEFAYAGPLTEICLLGNVAKRVDARLQWDAAAMKITNLAEANVLLRTECRKGWSL